MKKFKQITSLVLAFLMVSTSISWNGLQVQAADSANVTENYYLKQTFETDDGTVVGSYKDNDNGSLYDTDGSTFDSSVLKITGKCDMRFSTNPKVTDTSQDVYIEWDASAGSGTLADGTLRLGGTTVMNIKDDNRFRFANSITGNNVSIYLNENEFTTFRIKLTFNTAEADAEANGKCVFYVKDGENWTEKGEIDKISLTELSLVRFDITSEEADGKVLYLDNVKVYTITEVTGGDDSGDGDDTGSDTETVTDGVYFNQTFEEGYEGIGTIFSDSTVTAENDSSLGQSAFKITASKKGSLHGSLSEVITADIADVVYIEMEVSAGDPVAAFGSLKFTFRDAEDNYTDTIWTTNAAGEKFKLVSGDWLKFVAGDFLKIGMKLTFNTAAEGGEANGTCEFSQIDAEGNWGAVEKTVSGLSITSFSGMRFEFAGTIEDRNLFLDNLKVYVDVEDLPPVEPEEPTDGVMIGDTKYSTFYGEDGALVNVEANQEIKLYKDITAEGGETIGNIVLSDGVTIDLNGHILEANYLVAFGGTKVVDNSTVNVGSLKVPTGKLILDKENGQIPVWNGEGYCFVTAGMNAAGKMVDPYSTSKYIYLGMEPTFKEEIQKMFEDGSDDNCVKFGVRLSWKNGNTTHVQDCYFIDDYVKNAYADLDENGNPVGEGYNVIMSIKVSNLNDFDGIKAYPFVASSNLGVECVHDTGFEVQNPVSTVE